MPANLLSKGPVAVGSLSIKGLSQKVARIPITNRGASEVNTGVVIPALARVESVAVRISALEATGTTKTIDVGTLSSESGGDADGFLDGVSTSSVHVVAGSLDTGVTRGALMRENSVTAATAVVGVHYITAVPRTISYTLGSAATEVAGEIFVVYSTLA